MVVSSRLVRADRSRSSIVACLSRRSQIFRAAATSVAWLSPCGTLWPSDRTDSMNRASSCAGDVPRFPQAVSARLAATAVITRAGDLGHDDPLVHSLMPSPLLRTDYVEPTIGVVLGRVKGTCSATRSAAGRLLDPPV